MRTLLNYLEGDEGREGTDRTPERVIEADEIFAGYKGDASSILTATFNGEGYDGHRAPEQHRESTPVSTICNRFQSACGLHSGRRIVGISKLARLVDLHARRLQNQERITKSIADDLEHHLQPSISGHSRSPPMVACAAVA